jgi:LytS/YehU family sensor histidine kinase
MSVVFFALTCHCALSNVSQFQIVGQDFINTAHGIIISGVTAGIKFTKDWSVKHAETQRLIKQKIANFRQFQKARIYPPFIFKTLNGLHGKIISGSPDTTDVILKLSDLLSYLLYEAREDRVRLETELNVVNDLLIIERANRYNHLTIRAKVTKNVYGFYIKPLILFPLLQNCIATLANTNKQKCKLFIEIKRIGRILNCRIMIEDCEPGLQNFDWLTILKNLRDSQDLLVDDPLCHEFRNDNNQSELNLALPLVQ